MLPGCALALEDRHNGTFGAVDVVRSAVVGRTVLPWAFVLWYSLGPAILCYLEILGCDVAVARGGKYPSRWAVVGLPILDDDNGLVWCA